jgi:hypothetical protein
MTLKYDVETQVMSLVVGRPVEIDGLAAMLQRVKKLLYTPAGEADIYARSEYGLEFYDKIKETRNKAVLSADLTKELTQKLVNGAAILGVRDVKVNVVHRTAYISFTLDTVYGIQEIEVHI